MPRLICVFILSTMLLTGCWDAMDVKDFIIPTLEGFDYQKETDTYVNVITFPLINQNEKSSDVITSRGRNLSEIDEEQANQSNWIIYLGDIKGIILGKEFAMGHTEMLDVLLRNPMLSLTPQMAVVDGTAEEIAKLEPQPSYFGGIGTYYIDMLRNATSRNFVSDQTIYEYLLNSSTPGFNPVMPVISAHDTKIKITGAALFKKNKMVAMVDDQDMRVLTWLRGEKAEGFIPFTLTDEQGKHHQLDFQGTNKRKVKAWMENDVPVFEVEVKLQGVIIQVSGDYRFAGEEQHVQMAGKALAQQVQRQCESFIQDLQQQYQVDAILLGKYARIKWPELVEQQDWDENFCNSIINVKVKTQIYGYGERA